MRIGAVVFWVVVAAVLGVVAVQTRPTPGPPGQTRAVFLGVDTAETVAIETRSPGEPGVRVERAGRGWSVSWTDAGGERRVWPADPDLARAGLRVLATAELGRREGTDEVTGGVELSFRRADGVVRTLRLGDRSVGGRMPGVLTTDGRAEAVWIDARLADALRGSSLRRWRDPRLAATDTDPTAVAIQVGDHTVELARDGGVWFVGKGDRISADRGAVDRLIEGLGEIRATSFVDRPMADADTGLGDPLATIRVRSGGETPGTRTVVVGRGVDAGVTAVFVRAEGRAGERGFGPVVARVTGEALGAIGATPEAYMRRTPIDPGRFDVGRIDIEPGGTFVRAIDGWRREGGASRSPGTPQLDAMLGLLSGVEASGISVGQPAGGGTVVRLGDAARGEVLTLTIRRTPDGFDVSTPWDGGSVVWTYDASAGEPALGWISPE